MQDYIPTVSALVEAADHLTEGVQLAPAEMNPAKVKLGLLLRDDKALAFRALFEGWTLEELVANVY